MLTSRLDIWTVPQYVIDNDAKLALLTPSICDTTYFDISAFI